MTRLLQTTDAGLYCPQGNFHIDPWRPVERAVITHAHADHARPGSAAYLAATSGQHLMRTRLGADIDLQCLDYGETIAENGVTVSLHPAGHVLGSAQIRLEYQGEVAVVAGDYKVTPDPTCATFSRSSATRSSPNRHSACRFTAGRRAKKSSPASIAGGGPTATPRRRGYCRCGRQRLKLPGFWFGPRVGVLPAFGEFTGGAVVTPRPGDRVFVVAGDQVVPVS